MELSTYLYLSIIVIDIDTRTIRLLVFNRKFIDLNNNNSIIIYNYGQHINQFN